MDLYLIRHGDSETDKPDEKRSLTAEGREAVTKTAQWVTNVISSPEVLFSSPLQRAVETAEPFAEFWKLKVQKADWLKADMEPSTVIEELKKRKEQSFALVGHLPNLGWLLGALVWGLPPKEVIVPKAGVAYLEVRSLAPGGAKLKWMITPDLIK